MPYGLKSWLAYPLCDCRYNVNVWVYLCCHKNSICLDGSRIRNSLRIASVSVRFRSKERGTRDEGRAKNGAMGEAVLKFPSFPSPTPSFIFLPLVSFLAQPKPKIPLLGLSLPRKLPETHATQPKSAKKNFADSKISG